MHEERAVCGMDKEVSVCTKVDREVEARRTVDGGTSRQPSGRRTSSWKPCKAGGARGRRCDNVVAEDRESERISMFD